MMNITSQQVIDKFSGDNWLKTPASINDTANEAVFLASDKARMITGTVFNASAGAAMD